MQQEVNLLYQEKNRRPFNPRPHGVQEGITVRNQTQRNLLFFSQSEHKRHWGRVQDNTTHLSTVKPLNSGHLRVLKICPLLRGARYWEIV